MSISYDNIRIDKLFCPHCGASQLDRIWACDDQYRHSQIECYHGLREFEAKNMGLEKYTVESECHSCRETIRIELPNWNLINANKILDQYQENHRHKTYDEISKEMTNSETCSCCGITIYVAEIQLRELSHGWFCDRCYVHAHAEDEINKRKKQYAQF